MDTDLQELESQLQGLRPAALDDALLDRLSGAIAGTAETTDAGLRPVEAATGKLQPAGLSESLTERLAEIVDQVPFPVDEKVVLFPKGSAAVEEKKSGFRWWAAAAAVALAGGLSALMLSPPQETGKIAEGDVIHSQINPGAFVPAAFNSGVSNTDDLGVVWTDEHKPMRVVRVVYMDRVIFTNEKGDRLQRDIPRVEYLMVPENID